MARLSTRNVVIGAARTLGAGVWRITPLLTKALIAIVMSIPLKVRIAVVIVFAGLALLGLVSQGRGVFPRAQRYRRGEYSPEGCYFDAHDCDALNKVLLDPLGPGGDRRIEQQVYDQRTDAALPAPVTTAPVDAVLVFDGVFLMRPELIDRWDLRIFVSTTFDQTVSRALIRERGVFSASEVERRWRNRYIPSQQFYFATVRPADHADIVVHNDEFPQSAWEARALRSH